ncbi:MAG: nucleotidyltransferase domain-containing protein, partial [archaeon]
MVDNKSNSVKDKKPTNLANIAPGPVANNYQSQPANVPQQAVDFDKIKTKLDNLKKAIVKKYKFTVALSILPGPAAPIIEEDEGIPKEVSDSKPMYMLMIIPEEEYKNLPKIKPEIVKLINETKENIWAIIKTPVDLWNYGLDSKFEMIDAVSAGFPLHDAGFLGALRLANIHKSLVLRKFERYVTSYVIGGSLVRGTASKDSDVDVFVIIDDTDVKRMPRLELLDKLRGIIYDYIREATALSGVKNVLNVQCYLLTDFWQSVKDAHPVMFTFIRDGIPFYDRGTFIPWKLLLKMGKIKPSTEAIDLYMKQGDQTEEMVKRRMLDAMVDTYYGIVTPTQALMMLAGEAPPVPKTIVEEAKKLFVEKLKVMTVNDLKTLEKAVYLFKQYEYGKLKEYPGKDVDLLVQESKEYNKKLKALRAKIEKNMHEKSINDLNDNIFKLLETFLGKKSRSQLIKEFEIKMVKKGKISPRFLPIIKDVESSIAKIKAGKIDGSKADNMKKDAIEL